MERWILHYAVPTSIPGRNRSEGYVIIHVPKGMSKRLILTKGKAKRKALSVYNKNTVFTRLKKQKRRFRVRKK